MSPAKTWFVTGTDTDAGKTHVGRALLMAARSRGLKAIGYKPVESGCPDGTVGPDAQALAMAANTEPTTSYSFEEPVAPWLAANLEGEVISITRLQSRAEALQQECEFLLIEGAGGFLVPLTEQETIADLALAVAAPVLIVAPDRLGTINHCLLSVAAVRARGLQVAAVILSEPEEGAGEGLDNEVQIRAHAQVPVLRLPHARTSAELGRGGRVLLHELFADELLANAKA
jgi:dethiobiotin synthetase